MDIKNNSLIFASENQKLEILQEMSERSLFLDLRFLDSSRLLGRVDKHYHFHLRDKYGIGYDLANKYLPYFDYIDCERTYESKRLEELKLIKKDLVENGVFSDYVKLQSDPQILAVDKMPVPWMFGADAGELVLGNKADNPVTLYEAENGYDSCLAVYEVVARLLEGGFQPRDIVILNADRNDIYQLRKIFLDAGIPLDIDIPTPIYKYPMVINLVRVLETEGYTAFKAELGRMPDGRTKDAVIRIVNRHPDSELTKYPDILTAFIKSTALTATKTDNAVTIGELTNLVYAKDKHYLVLNYTDSDLVSYRKHPEYLTPEETTMVGFPDIDAINLHLETRVRNLLARMENLTLFFAKNKQKENRKSDLCGDRQIIEIPYQYHVKKTSHLAGLNLYEYAKSRHAWQNYSLKRDDFGLLENTFGSDFQVFTHDFTGIDNDTLKGLLAKRNTLTGAKLESYNLCRFQFLLKYLLRFSEIETTTSQFLGTMTHKVFEEVLKNKDADIDNIVGFHLDFPETEKHKERVYRQALLGELRTLLPVFIDFHEQSGFDLILTEIPFRLPYDDFFITGTIDKAMVYRTGGANDYFVLIDYKINDKDFKIDLFEQGRMLQIPIYMYAFIKMNGEMMHPAGMFYQKTGVGRYHRGDSPTADFRLQGIALENEAIMRTFDGDLKDVKGVSIKKEGGFASSDRVLPESEFNAIFQKVESQIDSAIKNIKKGDFSINPLPSHGILKDSVSCQYCEFSHICYNKNRGLGGDEE